jgi:hypothetical protein
VVDEARQQHDLADVGHAQAKRALRLMRRKDVAAAARFFDARQHLGQIRVQGLRSGRRRHARRGAGEQRVVELAPQLAQGDAGAGLLDAQTLRRTRDALRSVNLDEDAEPVEIKLGHGRLYENDMRGIRYWALTQ